MRQLALLWDTSLTSASLSYSYTALANSITCQLRTERRSEFTTANDSVYHVSIGRFELTINLSTLNFNDSLSGDYYFKQTMKFIAAPVRRIVYIPNVVYPDINGYIDFNAGNTINLNVDDWNTTWRSNRSNRSIQLTLSSEDTYDLSI